MVAKRENLNPQWIQETTEKEKINDTRAMYRARTVYNNIKKLIGGNFDNYDRNTRLIIAMAYNGEGLNFANINELNKNPLQKVDAYDLSKAYPAALCSQIFPLGSELTDKPTACGIFKCTVNLKTIKRKIQGFKYELFRLQLEQIQDNGYFYLSNINYDTFKILYDSDIQIIEKYYFKECGKIPKKAIEYILNILKETEAIQDETEKAVAKKGNNTSFYGKFVQNINEKPTDTYENFDINELGFIRNPEAPIGMFIIDYVRNFMTKQLNKYQKSLLYGNTDSLFFKANTPIKFKTGNTPGRFKKEIIGQPVLFIKRGFYLVYDDIQNRKINYKKSALANVSFELSDSQQKAFENGNYVLETDESSGQKMFCVQCDSYREGQPTKPWIGVEYRKIKKANQIPNPNKPLYPQATQPKINTQPQKPTNALDEWLNQVKNSSTTDLKPLETYATTLKQTTTLNQNAKIWLIGILKQLHSNGQKRMHPDTFKNIIKREAAKMEQAKSKGRKK